MNNTSYAKNKASQKYALTQELLKDGWQIHQDFSIYITDESQPSKVDLLAIKGDRVRIIEFFKNGPMTKYLDKKIRKFEKYAALNGWEFDLIGVSEEPHLKNNFSGEINALKERHEDAMHEINKSSSATISKSLYAYYIILSHEIINLIIKKIMFQKNIDLPAHSISSAARILFNLDLISENQTKLIFKIQEERNKIAHARATNESIDENLINEIKRLINDLIK